MLLILKHQLVYVIILEFFRGGCAVEYSTWNLKKAKQQRKFLVKNNIDGRYDIDIELINSIINETVSPFDHSLSLKEKLEYDKEKLDEYAYFMKAIESFYNTTKKFKIGSLWQLSVPIDDLMTFVNDFFRETFPDWYGLFNSVYKERRNNFRMGKKRSCELYIPGVDYSYIEFKKSSSIEDLFAIVHEYTHTIVDRIKYRESYDEHYPFIELPSITAEMIAKEFVKSYYSKVKGDIRDYFMGFMAAMNNYAKNILMAQKFLDKYSLENEMQIKNNLRVFTNYSKIDDEALTDKLQLENICYVVPYIYAIEFYFLYQKDKELFQYNMKKTITMEDGNNYLKEMKKLGLVPNQNINNFIQNIKRG